MVTRGEQPTALTGERAVHPVVGAHEPPRFGFGHGDLEGPQVDLAQGPVGHDRVDAVAFELRVVGDEVLDGGADAAALYAPDERSRYSACEHRVLRIALEVAATEGRPVDVDGRSQKHVAGAGTGLGGQNCTEFLDQFPIPGGTERRAAIEAGLPDVILHGGATQAIACSALVNRCLNGEVKQVRRFVGALRAMVLLDSTLTLRCLAEVDSSDGRDIFFDLLNAEGQPAIAGGYLRVEP